MMHRAEHSDNENLRHQADVILLSYGFSKPPQLRDTTVNADINVTKKIAMSFVVSDLANTAVRRSMVGNQPPQH
jgi:hypothetical protein